MLIPHAQWGDEFGGSGGNPFQLSATGRISKIRLWSEHHIDALQFWVDGSGWSEKYGGNGGEMQCLELKEEDDCICSIRMSHGDYIDNMTFESRNGQTLIGGGQGGQLIQGRSGKLVDVRGRIGNFVDQLQFKWESAEADVKRQLLQFSSEENVSTAQLTASDPADINNVSELVEAQGHVPCSTSNRIPINPKVVQ